MTATTVNPISEKTLTTIQLAKGFETIILTLTEHSLNVPAGAVAEYPDGYSSTGYAISGTSFDRTSHGAWVGDTQTRTRPTLAEAREYANGWFAHLTAKGWQRVK